MGAMATMRAKMRYIPMTFLPYHLTMILYISFTHIRPIDCNVH
jgi:hypothetical protein